MKETFIEKNFGLQAIRMIGLVNDILDDYSAQGYDLSLDEHGIWTAGSAF